MDLQQENIVLNEMVKYLEEEQRNLTNQNRILKAMVVQLSEKLRGYMPVEVPVAKMKCS